MKEAFAMEHPVETLLCGPAASALGGVWMTEDDDALVVDIGGTTTDIAIIRDGMAVTVDDGIRINGWKTFVKGMFIDTFGLGGDSAIRYEGKKLWLENYRIIPIAMVCREYPVLAEKIADYAKQTVFIDRYPYEGYVLLRDVEDSMLRTEWEHKFFEALRKGPVTMEDAAQIGGRYSMEKNLRRFIKDEHVMRFGLTPTDMMHIRGDYSAFDAESSRNAVRVLSRFCTLSEDRIPQIVYDAFIKKLTVNIERVLLTHRFAKEKEEMPQDVFDFLWHVYEDDRTGTVSVSPASGLPIIGVGGPSHIFMKDAAKRLSTRAVLPEHAAVANAIGTLAGQIVVRESSDIVYYPFGKTPGFRVFLAEGKTDVEEFDDAASLLTEYLTAAAREKAISRGAQGEVTITVKVEKKEEVIAYSDFLFGGTVTVTAYGNII
jgi:N-methylhydantoinase A/oxoprolinase/acetone carboxylase beta subunit